MPSFGTIQTEYTRLLTNYFSRWDQMLSDVRQRRYSPQSLLSDVLGYWTDAAAFSAVFMKPTTDVAPRVALAVDAKTRSAAGAVSVDEDANATLAVSDLLRADGAKGKIAAGSVQANLFENGRILVVNVAALPSGLKAGQYTSQVSVQEGDQSRAIAEVVLTVAE